MRTKKSGKGLCPTCNNDPNCSFPGILEGKFQCEEFDSFKPYKKDSRLKTAVSTRTRIIPCNGDANKGLCWDCENVKSCNFPKPESGIWHCNEYR